MLNWLKLKINKISSDRISVLSLVGGTTIAQGINFVFSPIQTRLFSPNVFGQYAVFTSITNIFAVIICLRYELTIVIPKEDDNGFALLNISYLISTIFSFIVALIFFLYGNLIYRMFDATALQQYWYYVPITLILTGIIQASNYWLIRKRSFKIISLNKIVPVLAVNIVSISFGLFGKANIEARLFSNIISLVSNILIIVPAIIPDYKHVKKNLKKKYQEQFFKYSNCLKFDVWSALISNLSWMVVPILINTFYSANEAGQYSIGLRVIQIPLSIIGASFSQVFYKNACEKRYSGELYSYTIGVIKKLIVLTLPLIIVLLLFSKPMFIYFFGKEWGLAGEYAQIMSIWALAAFIATPISTIMIITNKQNILLISNIIIFISRLVSLYVGKIFNSSIIGLLIFSISGFIFNIIMLLIYLYYAKSSEVKLIKNKNDN